MATTNITKPANISDIAFQIKFFASSITNLVKHNYMHCATFAHQHYGSPSLTDKEICYVLNLSEAVVDSINYLSIRKLKRVMIDPLYRDYFDDGMWSNFDANKYPLDHKSIHKD